MILFMLTNLNFLNTGMPFPVDDLDTKTRLEGYAKNKLLFEGKHSQVFTDLARYLREDGSPVLAFSLNWHKRITTTFANFLYGETPGYSSKADSEGNYLKSIIDYNNFNQIGYEVILDVLRYSVGLFKIAFDGERAIIESQNPAFWYPIVSPDNIKKIQYHVLAWSFEEIDDKGQKKTYLRAEIHSKGKIENRLYELESGKIGEQIKPISLHPRYNNLKDNQDTKINDFLIVPVYNLQTSDNPGGLSDYDDINDLIQGVESRVCQIDRVVTKHSDPNMAGPESCIGTDPDTGDDIFKSGGKYWGLESGENPPAYITWDGKLESGFKEIELFMNQLFALSETSPILFGDSGKLQRADSSAALKRLLVSTLSKVNRLRLAIDPKAKKVLKLASQIEVSKKVPDSVELADIEIAWRDGLPEDPKELAEIANLEGTDSNEIKNEVIAE